MKNPIEDILNELGWKSDSFKIPVANEENKQLEEQIEQKVKLKGKLKSDLECLENLIKTEKDNVTRFEKEYEENKKLIVAFSSRIEMERNLYNLMQSQNSKIAKEIQESDKIRRETNSKAVNLEDQVLKLKKKIQATKQKIKRRHNYLLQSEEEIDKKERRAQLIEEFSIQDSKKFKEYERERAKRREDLEVVRNDLVKAINEINEMEIVLENTTKIHSEMLTEHFALIRQCAQNISVLQQRDDDIEKTINEINRLRESHKLRKEEAEEADTFLKSIISDNKTLEIDTKRSEKSLTQLKEEYKRCLDLNQDIITEINVQKKEIRHLSKNLENLQSNCKQKNIDIERKRAVLDECNRKVWELNNKMIDISSRETDINYKTQQLENTYENEIKREEKLLQMLKHLQNQLLLSDNRVNELENEQKYVISQESFEIKKTENLDILENKCEKLLLERKQEANNYGLEIKKCEKELQLIMGNDDNDQGRNKLRIEELNKIYNDKLSESKRIHGQLVVLENDLRQLTNCVASGNEQLTRIKSKKHDLTLVMEGGEKQLMVVQTNTEEKQVEENILRLKVRQADKLLSKIDDKVYDLEKYKLEIEALLQERKVDIVIQKESLTLEKRLRSNEYSELNCQIMERKTRIQQLQTRYYNYVLTFGNDQIGDNPLNTTYLKIQIAQEKFFLKEQGDNLDRAIQKCEYEIQSMENTLKIINACNSKYKSNLAVIDEGGPENLERKKLNEEMWNCMEKIKQRKTRVQEMKQELEKRHTDYQQLLQHMEDIIHEKENKRESIKNLDRQIIEQRNKIIRASKNINKLFTIIQNMCKCGNYDVILLQQKDVELKELDELNLFAIQRLCEFMIRHIEAEEYVKRLLTKKNIDLPAVYHIKPSPASSRCGSSAKSTADTQNKNDNSSKIPSSRGSVSSIINIQPPW